MNTPPPPPPNLLTPNSGANRRIAVAVDLSDECAQAVSWAIQNYLRPGDSVVLLHVRPTSVLYGADWGSIKPHLSPHPNDQSTHLSSEEEERQMEDEYDNFTATKAKWLAGPLEEAGVPYKVHIVKDHDLKRRLCLEVERLGLSAVIMGSRGFGAMRRIKGAVKKKLGSVSDYCVKHSICPVVVVRFPEVEVEEKDEGVVGVGMMKRCEEKEELYPVHEEDASEEEEVENERC